MRKKEELKCKKGGNEGTNDRWNGVEIKKIKIGMGVRGNLIERTELSFV